MAAPMMMGDEEPSLLESFGAGDEMAEEDEEVADAPAEERAVQDFFDAGNSGDYAAATEAFKRAYKLCSKAKAPAEPAASEDTEYLEE